MRSYTQKEIYDYLKANPLNVKVHIGDLEKGKRRKSLIKKAQEAAGRAQRAIHTFNLSNSLPKHIHDAKYGYTEQDEKEWDEFCKSMYGNNLKTE